MEVRRGKVKAKEKEYHHGDLRQALVKAALDTLEKEGTGDLTLRDLARQVGVSHTAPYRHFEDKSALLLELAEECFKEMLLSMQGVAELPEGNTLERFRFIATAYVKYALEHPARIALMFGEDVSDRCNHNTLPSAAVMLELVIQLIVQGQQSGQIAAGDPMVKAVAAWSMVHGLSMLLINGRLKETGLDQLPPETLTASLTEVFMKGAANA